MISNFRSTGLKLLPATASSGYEEGLNSGSSFILIVKRAFAPVVFTLLTERI